MHLTFSRNHESKPEPHDDMVLWRYMDFPKFLDLITTSTLKMPRASFMEDKYEGFPGTAAIDATLANWKRQRQPSYIRHVGLNQEIQQAFFWQERTYISCWNAFPHENAGLWRIYGDDKGLAIKTTWKSLRESFDGTADCISRVFYGGVDYRDFQTDKTAETTYTDQYFAKRSQFSHENEFRLVAHDESKEHDYKSPDSKLLPHFATLNCDPNVLIEELIVSPRLGAWVTGVVGKVTEKYEGGWNTRQSDLYQPPERYSDKF
ncbi:DUF2971 domain-containing protein [Corynebacterium qintianiae]|uniref:DUF2971 domain-containing protein n=1 Tax=Corynebacterium qintianiae TaxID=2709392 RepID=UPI0013EA1299|nr:DUF2971 domain-containing protein [Corynebacterium qintianiae]